LTAETTESNKHQLKKGLKNEKHIEMRRRAGNGMRRKLAGQGQ
jgi:hypothetical protein